MEIDFYSIQTEEFSVSRRERMFTCKRIRVMTRNGAELDDVEELSGSGQALGKYQAHEDIDEDLQDDCTAAVEEHIGRDAGAIGQE